MCSSPDTCKSRPLFPLVYLAAVGLGKDIIEKETWGKSGPAQCHEAALKDALTIKFSSAFRGKHAASCDFIQKLCEM